MNTTTNTTPKTKKRAYRRTGKYAKNNAANPIITALRALSRLTPEERTVVVNYLN